MSAPAARVAAGAMRALLPGGRWHFQHGPIDLVIAADGDQAATGAAIEQAWGRFQQVLAELACELPLLRQAADPGRRPLGRVAARMQAACLPHLPVFVTPMAAVAGAVADEIVLAFQRPGVERASINNGGDIALYFADGATPYRIGVRDDVFPGPLAAGAAHPVRLAVGVHDAWRGIATSGWRGRSQSLGIADAVTVIATTAAVADVAATLIANEVNVEDPSIRRLPATQVRPGSDLGDRLVTVEVGPLSIAQVDAALARGAAAARRCVEQGLAGAAVLSLQGRRRWVVPAAESHREAA
jgi:uncharacterized protein